MKKYRCTVCDWVYDPEVGDPDSGIAPGTMFEDIPDDWTCPLCGVGKSDITENVLRISCHKQNGVWQTDSVKLLVDLYYLKPIFILIPCFPYCLKKSKSSFFLDLEFFIV